MRFLTSIACSRTSKPSTLAFPSVGGRKQVRTRIVVVFPAPFLPRNPTISPLPTSKEMFLTATWRAYRLVRPSTLIICVYVVDERCDGTLRSVLIPQWFMLPYAIPRPPTIIPGFGGLWGKGFVVYRGLD